MLSDHFVAEADLPVSRPRSLDKIIYYRKYDAIDIDEFSDELVQPQLITDSSDKMCALVDRYSDGLMSLVDKHIPAITKTFVQRTTVSWHNQAIQQSKRDRRRLERFWNRTGLVVLPQKYNEPRHRAGELTECAKSEYYNENS